MSPVPDDACRAKPHVLTSHYLLTVKTDTAFSCTQMLVVSDDVQSTGSSLDPLSGHICLGDIDIICELKCHLMFEYNNNNFYIALFSGVPKLTALYIILLFLSFTNIIHVIMTTNNV